MKKLALSVALILTLAAPALAAKTATTTPPPANVQMDPCPWC